MKISDIKPPEEQGQQSEAQLIGAKKKPSFSNLKDRLFFTGKKPTKSSQSAGWLNIIKSKAKKRPPKIAKKKSRSSLLSILPLSRGKIGSLAIILVIVLIILVYLSVLGIEVKVWPVLADEVFEETVTIDSNYTEVVFSEKIVPGKFLEKEGKLSKQFKSSEAILREVAAEGVIRVYNNYHLPQTLVATTRFLSPNEELFRSTKKVYIPAGATMDVEVRAVESGSAYNIEPTTFSIPGLAGSPRYTAVFGKSFSKFTGGYSGEGRQVTEEDLEKAETSLKEKLIEELKTSLKRKSQTLSFSLIDDSFTEEVIDAVSLAPAGTETDQFNFTVEMKAKAFAFAEKDLKKIITDIVLNEIGEEKHISPAGLNIEYTAESIDGYDDKMDLEVKALGKIYSGINSTSFKQLIAGKSINQGKTILEQDAVIARVEVKKWAFWRSKFPTNQAKLDFKIILD